MKTIFSAIAFCLLFSNTISSQVTYDDNDPGANFPLGFLGWNDNTNTERLRQLPLNDTADVFITGRQEDALGDYVAQKKRRASSALNLFIDFRTSA